MTHVHATAILMALAPAAPDSFEHAPQPEWPSIHSYLRDLDAEAGRYQYVDSGEKMSLEMEADSLAAWFTGEAGREPMDAAPAIEDAMKAVLEQHPNTDKKALKKIGEQLIEALERFAVDYRKALAVEDAWASSRDVAWRQQWAQRMMDASRELAASND